MNQRILIVAENASDRLGGEAILPCHYFRLLRARGVDAHLVVHERCREDLQRLFPADLSSIQFITDQGLQKLFFRTGKLLPRRVSEATFGLANQLLTQRAQRSALRRLVTPHSVVHQPIPVSPRFPSLIHDVGAPVVIGPLNGGMEYPAAFRSAESGSSRAAIAVGRSFTNAFNALMPGKRRAAAVLVANERTRDSLPSGLQGRVILLPENAVDLNQWPEPSSDSEPAKRFVFVGRLVDWKALDIAFHALQRTPVATLDVIGDGPMRTAWGDLAQQLGLEDRVHFRGWLSQAECARILVDSAALVLPSVYECGGAVVLEAMAMSRPVIATAWGGPLDYLDATCGILVPPVSREALIAGFAAAMERLVAEPEFAKQLGQAGRKRLLQHFDWQKKIDAMLAVYASVTPAITARRA